MEMNTKETQKKSELQRLVVKFIGGTEITNRDREIFSAHTGGNPGGSSTPSCTQPTIQPGI